VHRAGAGEEVDAEAAFDPVERDGKSCDCDQDHDGADDGEGDVRGAAQCGAEPTSTDWTEAHPRAPTRTASEPPAALLSGEVARDGGVHVVCNPDGRVGLLIG